MPSVKGALYVDNCIDEIMCFWATPVDFGISSEAHAENIQNMSFDKPLYNTTIYDNKFISNRGNVLLQSTQT